MIVDKNEIRSVKDCIRIDLTRKEVDEGTGFGSGPVIANIYVKDGDREAGFWLCVKINNQGRPVAEICTDRGTDGETHKRVTGTFKKD